MINGETRSTGLDDSSIGEALGVSRQSAWEYSTRRVSNEISENVAESDLSEEEAMELAVEEGRAARRRRSH